MAGIGTEHTFWTPKKLIEKKIQEMPQSQTAANPQHQEEEKKDKNSTRKTNKKCTKST